MKKNNVIKEGFTVEKTWKLSLDIKRTGPATDNAVNILRVGISSAGDQGMGARVPALFFIKNSARNGLYSFSAEA